MRLTFVIAGLTGGGAERVLSVLANESADRGHDVTVITLDADNRDFYHLRPSVERVHLDIDPESSGLLHRAAIEYRLLRALRTEFRRRAPDAVVSFATETNARVLLAALGLGLHVIVSERSDPATMPIARVWALLRRRLYGLADAVVVQTAEALAWISANTSARHAVVIPNPVTVPVEGEDAGVELPQPLVVAMGRLRPEKGHDLLIDAFAQTRAAHPEWHLGIIGDGPEREALERRVAARSLSDAVTFVGQLAHPSATLRQAQLFVLPSRFEGFPNALIEAMALGLPVVSFDCPSGPRSIIHHDVDGVLVPPGSVHELASAMSRMMQDTALRARLAAAASRVSSRFAVHAVVTQWLALARRDASAVAPGKAMASAKAS